RRSAPPCNPTSCAGGKSARLPSPSRRGPTRGTALRACGIERGCTAMTPGAARGAQGPEASLCTVNLHKEYPLEGGVVRALRGLDMAIHPGEFVAIMVPSGSGKSTLLNI